MKSFFDHSEAKSCCQISKEELRRALKELRIAEEQAMMDLAEAEKANDKSKEDARKARREMEQRRH